MKQRRDILKALAVGAVGVAGMGLATRANAKTKVKNKTAYTASYMASKKAKYPDEPVKYTKFGNLIFASGFVCLPHEGPRTIENHTAVAMGKLESALKEAGAGLDKVIRITAWIDDIANYSPLNGPYAKAFPGGKRLGNRSCMAVPKGTIPGNSMVCFDAVARIS